MSLRACTSLSLSLSIPSRRPCSCRRVEEGSIGRTAYRIVALWRSLSGLFFHPCCKHALSAPPRSESSTHPFLFPSPSPRSHPTLPLDPSGLLWHGFRPLAEMGADRSHLGHCLPVHDPRCGMARGAKEEKTVKQEKGASRKDGAGGGSWPRGSDVVERCHVAVHFFSPSPSGAPCSLGVREDPSRPFLLAALADEWAFPLHSLVSLPIFLALSPPHVLASSPCTFAPVQRSCCVAFLSELGLYAAIHVRGDECEFAHNSTSPCPSLTPPALVVSLLLSLLSRHSI